MQFLLTDFMVKCLKFEHVNPLRPIVITFTQCYLQKATILAFALACV